LDHKIRLQDEAYRLGRDRYEAEKHRFFEQFYHDRAQLAVAGERFYTDRSMTVGLSAVDPLPAHLLLTIEIYDPCQSLAQMENLLHHGYLQDDQGRRLGSPVESTYDRLPSVHGLIVTLAYKHPFAEDRDPVAFVMQNESVEHRAPIVLALSRPTDEGAQARLLNDQEYRSLTTAQQTPTPLQQTQVIACRRVGRHLKVPVQLDIHGVIVPTTMILDTGSTMTVLPKALYNQGLAKPLDSLRTVQTRTANGILTCPVDRVGVSTSAFGKAMPVLLINSSMALLGTDYFSGYRFTVDLDQEHIVVHPTDE
jgi:hypothetical protein